MKRLNNHDSDLSTGWRVAYYLLAGILWLAIMVVVLSGDYIY